MKVTKIDGGPTKGIQFSETVVGDTYHRIYEGEDHPDTEYVWIRTDEDSMVCLNDGVLFTGGYFSDETFVRVNAEAVIR